MEGVGDKFSKIMMKLSIIKLVLAIVTLIVMTVLLFTHLHVFDPITLHFSRWVIFSHNLFYYVSSSYKVCWAFDRFDIDIDVNKENYF